MKAVIAVNNLGFIGIDDKLLWKNKKDLKHFKNLTFGSTCLVGYVTWKSLPKLPNREIVVISREDEVTDHYEDCEWCIGGKKTYERYCHLFTELHISHIDDNKIGNVVFPDLTNLNPDCKVFNYNF